MSPSSKETLAAKLAAISTMNVIVPPIDQVEWLLRVEQDTAAKKALKKLTIDHKRVSRRAQEADRHVEEMMSC